MVWSYRNCWIGLQQIDQFLIIWSTTHKVSCSPTDYGSAFRSRFSAQLSRRSLRWTLVIEEHRTGWGRAFAWWLHSAICQVMFVSAVWVWSPFAIQTGFLLYFSSISPLSDYTFAFWYLEAAVCNSRYIIRATDRITGCARSCGFSSRWSGNLLLPFLDQLSNGESISLIRISAFHCLMLFSFTGMSLYHLR